MIATLDRLAAELSSTFVRLNGDRIGDALDAALCRIGEALDFDRSTLRFRMKKLHLERPLSA